MRPAWGGSRAAGHIALIGLLCLGGCSAIFDVRECEQQEDCPAPRRCVDGLCRPVSPDPGDAAAPRDVPEQTAPDGAEAEVCRPLGPEQPYNGLDDDCDPETPDDDLDGDGFRALDDCDDRRSELHPGALDLCGDGEDWDCSGEPDQPCLTLPLDQPRMRPTALAATPDGRLVVGFTPALEGLEASLRIYEGLELQFTMILAGGRSVDRLVVDQADEGVFLWGSDGTVRNGFHASFVGIGLGSPEFFDVSPGRPLEPTALAVWHDVERESQSLVFVGGTSDQAAWAWAYPPIPGGTLPDSPSPSLVGISWDGRRPLVVSAPDRTLRIYATDARSQPVVSAALELPGVAYDLAVLPGRVLLLLADRVAVVNLDALRVEPDSLPSAPGAFRMALGPAHRWLYLLTESGSLQVVDRPAGRLLRQVDLRRAGSPAPEQDHRPTDLVVMGGRVYVSLAGQRPSPQAMADSFVAVVEP